MVMGNCSRCNGSGNLPHFVHVMNGVCFRCWGSGSEPESAEELRAWLEKARNEYRARLNALKAAPANKANVLRRELSLLEKMGKAAKARLVRISSALGRRPSAGIKGRSEKVTSFKSYSSDREYEIRRSADKSHLYCSCPAWKYQKRRPQDRTCKHLEDLKVREPSQLSFGGV